MMDWERRGRKSHQGKGTRLYDLGWRCTIIRSFSFLSPAFLFIPHYWSLGASVHTLEGSLSV